MKVNNNKIKLLCKKKYFRGLFISFAIESNRDLLEKRLFRFCDIRVKYFMKGSKNLRTYDSFRIFVTVPEVRGRIEIKTVNSQVYVLFVIFFKF